MGERILFLDFDDVLIKTKQIVEPIVKKLNPYAAEEYLDSIKKKERLKLIDDEKKREMMQHHFMMKDCVLEEAAPHYQGIIDYDKVISIANIYPYAIEYVNAIYQSCYFDQICILSHYNVERESNAKRNFIDSYLKNIKFIPVPFHVQPYGVQNRVRTSKALFVNNNYYSGSLANCILLDDSLSNLEDWVKNGGQAVLFRPYTDREITLKSVEMVINGYPRITSFEKDDVIMPLTNQKVKIIKR